MLEFLIFIILLPLILFIFFPNKFKNNNQYLKHLWRNKEDEKDAVNLNGIYNPDYVSKLFMTQPEVICFKLLNDLKRPQDIIFSQVSMGAILELGLSLQQKLKGKSKKEMDIARSPFSSKIIDFAIYDSISEQIIVIVELDDLSHLQKEEQDLNRDLMLKCAGYVTVRIPFNSSNELTPDYIKNQLIKGGYRGTKK